MKLSTDFFNYKLKDKANLNANSLDYDRSDKMCKRFFDMAGKENKIHADSFM